MYKETYTKNQLVSIRDNSSKRIELLRNKIKNLEDEINIHRSDYNWAVTKLAIMDVKGE